MATAGPPAYAWDWFARQRLLWREARARIAAAPSPTARRYSRLETRNEVVPMLRADYRDDATVREAVDEVVTEVAFLGRTDRTFESLGLRNAPRGMRWWWSALTGEQLDGPQHRSAAPPAADQLSLDEVLGGYGG